MIPTWEASASSSPSVRIPVPASRMSWLLSRNVTCTHDVLPPKRFMSGPGAGTDPLAPHTLIFIGPPLPLEART